MFSALSKLPKTSLKTIVFMTQLLKGYEQSKTSISSRRHGAQSYKVRLDGKLSEYIMEFWLLNHVSRFHIC